MIKNPVFKAFLITSLLAPATAFAQQFVIINDDLDAPPAGFTLASGASANATAAIDIDDVGGSNGLVFIGAWDVPANGQEFAVGALVPTAATAAEFPLDLFSLGGAASLRWTLDLEVFSATMTPGVQGLYAQLVVYQLQADDTVLAYPDGGTYVTAGEALAVDVTAVATDFGEPGQHPDFSADGGPLAFGLQFGALYPGTPIPEPFFLGGRMHADNWTVTVTRSTEGDLFGDGFEQAPPAPASAAGRMESMPDCDCALPGAIPWPLQD